MKDILLPSGVTLKPIPVSPNDDYMAGSDGQIYSRTRYAGFGKKIKVDWYPLIGAKGKAKYLRISLCHENRKVTGNVHRLVCMAFHGPPLAKGSQTRHLDGNELNNAPTNLAWGTQMENAADKLAHGRVPMGEDHHAAKLINLERDHLRWAVAKGLTSQRNAARALGMSLSAIQQIVAKARVSG